MKTSKLFNKLRVKCISANRAKSFTRRGVSLLLSILMLTSIIPLSVLKGFAADETVLSGQKDIKVVGTYKTYACADIYYAKNEKIAQYKSGNNGAGSTSNPANATCALMEKVIRTDDGSIITTSTPIYRIWRAGGMSDDNTAAITVSYDTWLDASKLMNTCNQFIKKNNIQTKTLSLNQAQMIINVLQYGFRQHSNAKTGRPYDDMMYYAATQILIWEIQEGKRTGYDVGNNFCSAGNSWYNLHPTYWNGYWNSIYSAWRSKDSSATNYYKLILDTARTVGGAQYKYYELGSGKYKTSEMKTSDVLANNTLTMKHLSSGKWAKEVDFGQGFVSSGAYKYCINGAYNVSWVTYAPTGPIVNNAVAASCTIKSGETLYSNPIVRQADGIDERYKGDEKCQYKLNKDTTVKILGKTINQAYYCVEAEFTYTNNKSQKISKSNCKNISARS